MKKWGWLFILVFLCGCAQHAADFKPVEETSGNRMAAYVTRVVDGDTIKITIGSKEETVRFLLVDTPETKHPKMGVQPFGPEASAFTKEKLEGKNIELELGINERDKYGRLLAYVYVDGERFNDALLREGLARVAYIYPPNTRYLDELEAVQQKAKEEGKGIWSVEDYPKSSQ